MLKLDILTVNRFKQNDEKEYLCKKFLNYNLVWLSSTFFDTKNSGALLRFLHWLFSETLTTVLKKHIFDQ